MVIQYQVASAIRPVPHGVELPVPKPALVDEHSEEESDESESRNQPDVDQLKSTPRSLNRNCSARKIYMT